jgi:ketosteroid isomerase-like protein
MAPGRQSGEQSGEPRVPDCVRAFVAAFNAGELERQLSLATPDLVLTTAPEWPGGGRYAGREEVRRFVREFQDTWGSIRYEQLAHEVAGERLIERARWVGRGRSSGVETAVDFYTVWTVREDRVARMDVFATRAAAREFARS